MIKCRFKHTFCYYLWIRSTLKPTFYYEKGGDFDFSHILRIKSPRLRLGLFITAKCVKSQNHPPFYTIKYVCLIFHETNGLIMIPKTVLKSGLWRCSKKYGFNSNCQENYLKLESWCGFKSGFAFCKICLPNLARGYLSDHDSENCSEISAVTWSGIFFNFFKILTFVFFTPP